MWRSATPTWAWAVSVQTGAEAVKHTKGAAVGALGRLNKQGRVAPAQVRSA